LASPSDNLETEDVVLDYDESLQTYATAKGWVLEATSTTKYVKVPALVRNWQGFGGGIIARRAQGFFAAEGSVGEDYVGMWALSGYVGFAAMSAMKLSVDVEGYGNIANNRWNSLGLDLVADVLRSYDREPQASDAQGRLGVRLWGEVIFGSLYGVSGRLELGIYPGSGTSFLFFSLGGGANLKV
jgi:hypothetical protein